ncbi:MAG: hypothetical protein Q9163_000227, partial [Psora crenata]
SSDTSASAATSERRSRIDEDKPPLYTGLHEHESTPTTSVMSSDGSRLEDGVEENPLIFPFKCLKAAVLGMLLSVLYEMLIIGATSLRSGSFITLPRLSAQSASMLSEYYLSAKDVASFVFGFATAGN